MELTSQFRDIFSKKILEKGDVVIRRDSSVTLMEDASKPRMKAKIEGVRGVYALIHLASRKGGIYHLSALHERCRKICDYILLIFINGRFYAIFIELKTTLRLENQPYEQLFRSRPLLDYFLSVHDVEYKIRAQSKLKPNIKYALIYKKSDHRLEQELVRRGLSLRTTTKYKSITVREFSNLHVTMDELIR